jgi:endonuclease-8
MPEGDTVFKLAEYLRPALAGRALIAGTARVADDGDLAGGRIVDVFAHGKHLFIEFDDQRLLRSHLGMWGSWHGYAAGEAWRKPRRQASIVLDIGERVFVCFNALQVEILRQAGVRRRVLAVVLGPDLLSAAVDYDDVVQRIRALSGAASPVVDVLLDQRVATGIGNVYKSETLFIERWHPRTPVGRMGDDDLIRLYRRASDLLGRNVSGGPRVTRHARDAAGRLWVYGRAAQACLRCDAAIESARLGKGMRSTYWCPSCQTI